MAPTGFFYLTPTWPKLNSTQMRKMECTYRNLARVANDYPCPGGILAKTTAQMLSKVSHPPLQIALAAARLLSLPRLLKVAPTALLIPLDANRSWRDVFRHDCLSMWLQASFVNQVLPHPHGSRLLSWCDFATNSTRSWKHTIKAWARSRVPQDAWDQDSPHPCGVPPQTDILLHWPCVVCPLPRWHTPRRHMPRSASPHDSFFDVYCPCCLTLFHARQRVHEHLVRGKRSFLHALAASVEPASDALQQLIEQDKRVRRASKHLSLEWQPKHLPASGCTAMYSRGLTV